MAPHDLRWEAIGRIAVYYTDGSVPHLTGAVGATFLCKGDTALFRHPDTCSSTQAELVAISMSLIHAEETVVGPVVVHSDSMSTLQAISCQRCNDTVRFFTSIWRTLGVLESVGRRG